MRKALATTLVTAGLATLLGLLASGVHPSADPEVGLTAAFVLAVAAVFAGAYLFREVALTARRRKGHLDQLATFQMETGVFFDRALACRTHEAADELLAETQAWQEAVRAWFRSNLPVYESVFLSYTRTPAITYGPLPSKATVAANWAQERGHRLGEIIHTLARAEVD
jgi:hypothetical protein